MNINQNNVFGNNIVNAKPERHVDSNLQLQFESMLNKNEKHQIVASSGDIEAYNFANEIKNFLVSKNYNVEGHVGIAMTYPPMVGQTIDSNLQNGYRVIRIGHHQ